MKVELIDGGDSIPITAISAMEPTAILAHRDGTLFQLWRCRYSDRREWRRLPSFADALAIYGGEIVE